jgi:hypothetical protein
MLGGPKLFLQFSMKLYGRFSLRAGVAPVYGNSNPYARNNLET